MHAHIGLISVLSVCLGSIAFATQAPVPPPAVLTNQQITADPLDVAINGTGQFAIVRTGSIAGAVLGGTYIIDLTTLASTSFPDVADALGQDYISTIDNYCVTVCGGVPGGATRAYRLTPAPPSPILNQPASCVDVATAFHPMSGHALAITQGYGESQPGGGAFPGQGISIIDLSAALPTVVQAFVPRYVFGSGWGYGNATFLSDAVQATGSRAIAIANHDQPVLGGVPLNYGFVGITDFDGTHTATFGFFCNPAAACTGTPSKNEELHDVAVTPDGVHGIVSGNGVLGVYNLHRFTEVYKWTDHTTLPHMRSVQPPNVQITVDSVEATNTRAVIIGKDVENTGNLDPLQTNLPSQPNNELARWRVALVALDGPQGSQYSHFAYSDTATTPSRAHDLAITPNGAKAIVTTRRDTLVFDLTAHINAAGPVVYPTGCDPLEFRLGNLVGSAFVSDSVKTTDTQAVVIGRPLTPSSVPGALICLIDLVAPPGPGAISSFSFPDPTVPPVRYWLPTDVAIDGTGRYAVVRMVDDSILGPGIQSNIGRIVVIDMASKMVALDQQSAFGLPLGMAQGYDDVECSYDRVITAGELWKPIPGSPATSWYQILRLN